MCRARFFPGKAVFFSTHLDETFLDVFCFAERDIFQDFLVELNEEFGDRFGERLEEVALLSVHLVQVHRVDECLGHVVQIACRDRKKQRLREEATNSNAEGKGPLMSIIFRPSVTVSRIGLMESCTCRCHGGPPPSSTPPSQA